MYAGVSKKGLDAMKSFYISILNLHLKFSSALLKPSITDGIWYQKSDQCPNIQNQM